MNCIGDFNAYEQRIKDLLRIIENIEPLLQILKEQKRQADRLEEINEDICALSGKNEGYQNILKLLTDNSLIDKINEFVEETDRSINELADEEENLMEEYEELTENIDEYFEYIDSFNWINIHISEAIISRIPKEEKKSVVAAIILLLNEGIEDKVYDEIFNYLFDTIEDDDIRNALLFSNLGREFFIQYLEDMDL